MRKGKKRSLEAFDSTTSLDLQENPPKKQKLAVMTASNEIDCNDTDRMDQN